MSEHEYLEDNIATVAFHLGRPGARLSVQNDMPGLVVDPGEVLKEVSRRLNSHEALWTLLETAADMLGDSRSGYIAGSAYDEEYDKRKTSLLKDIQAVVGKAEQP